MQIIVLPLINYVLEKPTAAMGRRKGVIKEIKYCQARLITIRSK